MTAGVSLVCYSVPGYGPNRKCSGRVPQLEASGSSGGEEGETSAVWVAKQELALIACLTS